MTENHVPRAVGQKMPFDELAPHVRGWLRDHYGAVAVVREHRGGMSPGCATSFRTASGDPLFIKAVSSEYNDQTPSLFRHERRILERLPDVPYRARLVNAFDDGTWVALVLEAVDGRMPDLANDEDFFAVAEVVREQAVELTPAPAGVVVTTLSQSAERWAARWQDIYEDPQRFLPGWAAGRVDDLRTRVEGLPARLSGTTLCHFDVRDDNLLVQASGSPVVVDWGMARFGPQWADLAMLAWQRPSTADADSWLRRWIPEEEQETLTDLLVAFGGSQSWNAEQPPKPNLPAFAPFAADDAHRLLSLAAIRVG